jgi:catechol 2,3-dioxygenase-like lactoylglutathione lyase family enzyme
MLACMQPLAIHHVSVNVDDVEVATRFYVDVLGGTLRDDRPDFGFAGAWINLGGQQVHLIHATVPANEGQHFAVQVADLDGVVAELRGKGVDARDPVAVGSGRQSFVVDPSGNAVELHEVARS